LMPASEFAHKDWLTMVKPGSIRWSV
jgi:hypothetical protein